MKKCIVTFRKQKAFTLMEMLISVSLIGAVGLAAYHSLSIGFQAWERGQSLSRRGDVAIFMERFAQDMRNAVKHSQLRFKGDTHKVVIPTIIQLPMVSSGSDEVAAYIDQIGLVEYGYDYRYKAIYRKTAGYGQSLKKDFSSPRYLVSQIEEIRFEYLQASDRGLTVRKLNRDKIPDAIRVRVSFRDNAGQRAISEEVFAIPISGADESDNEGLI